MVIKPHGGGTDLDRSSDLDRLVVHRGVEHSKVDHATVHRLMRGWHDAAQCVRREVAGEMLGRTALAAVGDGAAASAAVAGRRATAGTPITARRGAAG